MRHESLLPPCYREEQTPSPLGSCFWYMESPDRGSAWKEVSTSLKETPSSLACSADTPSPLPAAQTSAFYPLPHPAPASLPAVMAIDSKFVLQISSAHAAFPSLSPEEVSEP